MGTSTHCQAGTSAIGRGLISFDEFIATSYPLREEEKRMRTAHIRIPWGTSAWTVWRRSTDCLGSSKLYISFRALRPVLPLELAALNVELASIKISDRISGLLAAVCLIGGFTTAG